MLSAEPEVPELTGTPPERDRNHLPALLAVLCVAVGVGYRFAMLTAQVPPTNSDEAVMGLAALHIRAGQEYPAFFYGQHYMGTLEAYLAVPFFAISEPSVLTLRLPNLLLYAAFLGLLWQLTRRLYTPWFATFTVGLLALGSDRILKNQMIAGGGYPEMNPAGTLLLLLGWAIARPGTRRRLPLYAAWGLLAGFLVWDDWLALPYVAAAGTLLLAFRGRELAGRAGLVLAATVLVGAAPLVAHFTAARLNPVTVLAGLSGGDGSSWPDRLYGGILFGVPMGTGMCSPQRCAPWQLWWGLAFPILLATAGVLAWRALRRTAGTATSAGAAGRVAATGGTATAGPSVVPTTERVRQAGRLALVAAAGLTLLAYVRTGAAGSTPVESARYLSCLLISTPAVLWPLWRLVGAGRAGDARPVTVRLGAAAVLAAVTVTALVATVALIARAPEAGRLADQRRALVATLRQLGVTHLYSDYWTCNNIIFASREKIVCAVLGDDLRPGLDRYPPYREAVARAPRPAYALPSDAPVNAALAARLNAAEPAATVVSVAGYDIYRPARPVHP